MKSKTKTQTYPSMVPTAFIAHWLRLVPAEDRAQFELEAHTLFANGAKFMRDVERYSEQRRPAASVSP